MKDETQETSDKPAPEPLAAILREMRAAAKSTDLFNGEEVGEPLIRGSKVKDWADRIEEAAKRELSRAAEDAASKATLDRTAKDAAEYMAYAMAHNSAPQSGNAAAMREALEEQLRYWNSHVRTRDEEEMRKRTEAALAAPPRNCDVGTADEQAERFEAECKRHDHCTPCPVHAAWGEFRKGKPKSCQLMWGQMLFAPAEGVKE